MHTSNACAVVAWPGSEFPTSQLRELIHRGSVRRSPGPYEVRPPREHSLDAKIGQDNTQVSRTLRLRSWQKSRFYRTVSACRTMVQDSARSFVLHQNKTQNRARQSSCRDEAGTHHGSFLRCSARFHKLRFGIHTTRSAHGAGFGQLDDFR